MTATGTAGKFRILLLGTPVIMQGEQPLRIQRRLTRGLLYYLAFHEQPVPRSQLVLLFWPDASEQDGRRRLREILSKLRAELPDPNLLVTEQEEVGLDQNLVTVDVREFMTMEEEIRKGTLLSRSGKMPTYPQQQISQAALLWRASRFMAGFELPECSAYQDWQMETSRSLEFLRLNMLSRLADHHLAAAEPLEAIRWLRIALEIDELDSDLHLKLLKAYRDLGRVREAQVHCDRLQDLYQREGMGAMPKPIQQLCIELHDAGDSPPSARKTSWPLPLEVASPFVGREQLMSRLRGKYTSGGAIVILGESGSGKSRLIFESCQDLQPEPRLLVTSGRSLESDMPLQPWIDLLRREILPEDWKLVDPKWLPFLTRLVPDVAGESSAGLSLPMEEDGMQRGQLFEAVRQLLLVLGKKNRLVVVFDDSQWGDQASFALLAYLLDRRFFNGKHVLLMACRLEETCQGLDELIEKKNRDIPVDVYTLDELQPESIALLVQAVLGISPDANFIQRLSRDTGGNPLLVLEILRAILEANIDPSLAGGLNEFPIPASIRAFIINRLNKFSSDVRKVILTAAVMGLEFSSSGLALATGIHRERLIDILEELKNDHLIRAYYGSDPEIDYTFIHDKLREVFITSLSPARLKLAHQKVAEALEQRISPSGAPPSALARHYELAGIPEKAFIYWLEAGRRARDLLSTAEATQSFFHAEQQLERVEPMLTDQQIHSLYTIWGEMALLQSDYGTKQKCYDHMLEHGRKRNSPFLIGAALSGMANIAIHRYEPAAGLSLAGQAILHLKRARDPYELIMALNRQAMCQQLLLDLPDAIRTYKEAQRLSANTSDLRIMDARTNSLSSESLLHIFMAFPEKALQTARQAISLSQVTGNLGNQARAYVPVVTAQDMMGDIPGSLENALEGIALCDRIQASHNNGYLQVVAAKDEFRLGYIDKAWQRCEDTERLVKDRFLDLQASNFHLKGYIFLRLGMIPEAASCFQMGMSIQGEKIQSAKNAYSFAYCMGLAGKTSEALDLLEKIIESAQNSQFHFIRFPSLINRSRILSTLGRISEAEGILKQVKQECEARKYWEHSIVCTLDLGRLELARGDRKAALVSVASVLRHTAHHQHIWHELDALQLESECLDDNDPRIVKNKHRRHEILEMIRNYCQLPQFQPAIDSLEKTFLAE